MTNIKNTTFDKKAFGERVKLAREKAGLTQRDVADRLFLIDNPGQSPRITDANGRESSVRYLEKYRMWEQGKNSVPIDQIPTLCKLLKCDAGYLFSEYDETQRQVSDLVGLTGLTEPAAAKLGRLAKLKNYSAPTVGTVYELNLPALLSAIVTHKKFLPFLRSCGLYKALAKAYDTRQEYAFDVALDEWSGCYDDLNQTVSDKTNGLYCVAPIRELVDQHQFKAQTQINSIIDSLADREEE